eukprot:2509050-Pleurochrysis_carterae.AAC.1
MDGANALRRGHPVSRSLHMGGGRGIIGLTRWRGQKQVELGSCSTAEGQGMDSSSTVARLAAEHSSRAKVCIHCKFGAFDSGNPAIGASRTPQPVQRALNGCEDARESRGMERKEVKGRGREDEEAQQLRDAEWKEPGRQGRGERIAQQEREQGREERKRREGESGRGGKERTGGRETCQRVICARGEREREKTKRRRG